MKLEEITAEIRPRTQWEAVDLGVTLTRQHFPKLAAIWALTVLPIWAILIFLFRGSPFWCLVAIVFLRPVYDRPILFYLSRALFNAPPKISEILRSYPKIIAPGLLRGLTIARFSPVRSLLLPLHVLEGVKGTQYKTRRTAVLRNGGGTGGYLTFVCAMMEMVLSIGVIFFLLSLVPEHLAPDWEMIFERFFSPHGISEGMPSAAEWFAIGVVLVAISFVEMFYVGCGFALYLNCRSHVEGWDIEITFRRLAAKIANTIPALLIALGLLANLCLPSVSHAQADDPPVYDEVKKELREILAHEDFEIHTDTYKQRIRKGSGTEFDGPDLSFLVGLGRILYWLTIIAAIIGLGFLIYVNRHLFTGSWNSTKPKQPDAPSTRTVMGMDIASDTLPADIPAAALAAWQAGDPQLATSLLYRGSICWLVETARLPLHDSDTESDCVRHSSSLPDTQATKRDYFSKLTTQWISTAYNDSPPTEPDIRQLCATWPFNEGALEA